LKLKQIFLSRFTFIFTCYLGWLFNREFLPNIKLHVALKVNFFLLNQIIAEFNIISPWLYADLDVYVGHSKDIS